MVGDKLESNMCERNGADQGVHNYYLYSGECVCVALNTLIKCEA